MEFTMPIKGLHYEKKSIVFYAIYYRFDVYHFYQMSTVFLYNEKHFYKYHFYGIEFNYQVRS